VSRGHEKPFSFYKYYARLGLVLLLLFLDEVLDHLLVLRAEATPVFLHLRLWPIKITPPAPILLLFPSPTIVHATIPIITFAAIASILILIAVATSSVLVFPIAVLVTATPAMITLPLKILFARFEVSKIVVDGHVFALFCLDSGLQHCQLILDRRI
jgi:hypothetical protein